LRFPHVAPIPRKKPTDEEGASVGFSLTISLKGGGLAVYNLTKLPPLTSFLGGRFYAFPSPSTIEL